MLILFEFSLVGFASVFVVLGFSANGCDGLAASFRERAPAHNVRAS
jgi:hypothetical protein